MSFEGTGAAGYLYSQRMRAQAQQWHQQILQHQAQEQAEQEQANMAYQQDYDTTDPGEAIYQALTSGDPEIVAQGAEALAQVYGEQVAEQVIGELASAFEDAYGEQAAGEWLDAAGYQFDEGETVLGEDLSLEQVADVIDEAIGRLEEERGEEFSPEEIEDIVTNAMAETDAELGEIPEAGEEAYDAEEIFGPEEGLEPEQPEPTAEEIVEQQVEDLQAKLGRELSLGELERMRGHVNEHLDVEGAHEVFGLHQGDRVEPQKFGAAADENVPAPSRHERLAAATEKLVPVDDDYHLELAAQAIHDKHAKRDEEYDTSHRYLAQDYEIAKGDDEGVNWDEWDAA